MKVTTRELLEVGALGLLVYFLFFRQETGASGGVGTGTRTYVPTESASDPYFDPSVAYEGDPFGVKAGMRVGTQAGQILADMI